MDASRSPQNCERQYPKLAASNHQFRLLTLEDDKSSESIHFSLQAVSLDASPPYVASSNTWGTEQMSKEIFVNGSSFFNRPNLHNVFIMARIKDFLKVPIFVDALCIHQCDIAEREALISLLRYIYGNVARVMAWLGTWDTEISSYNLASLVSLSQTVDRRADAAM